VFWPVIDRYQALVVTVEPPRTPSANVSPVRQCRDPVGAAFRASRLFLWRTVSVYGVFDRQLFQECCAVLRIESTRAREHAELVTALLMHFRNKGKMPKNWRRLTIGELIGFATTLPRNVESLGEMQEIPVLSQEEARFIERFAEKKTDIGLDYYQHGHSLVRKAKSRLCVEE